jgi:DNA/RNA endonuclease YhcR with UshA esterase domain
MSTCPSCGRDAGTSEICPHCGTDVKQRLKIRTFGILAIIVAVVGVALLLFFATRMPVPAVKIGDITSTSNYAYAQINGVVSRSPNYNPDAQSITFWVRDDSGEIMVSAFRDQTQGLIAADRVPAPGDTIVLQGTLRVRDETPSLTIDSADSVKLTRATAQAQERPIGSITPADDLHGAVVNGMIRQIKEPYPGLKLITLRDATGAIDLALPTDFEAVFGATPPITVGQSVKVIGTVTKFEDTPQIAVRRGADITPLAEGVELAKFVSLRNITEADTGKWVRTQGEVAVVAPGEKNTKLTLTDQDQRLTVLIWPDVWAALPQADLQPGAQLNVQGAVNVFRGDLEIVPELVSDLEVAVRPVAIAAQSKSIGAITPEDVNALVVTQGTIEDAADFSKGMRYTLSDPSGTIVLLVWDDAIDPQQRKELLVVGAVISVTGKIDQYNGQLEIAPRNPQDVSVLSAPSVVAEVTATPQVTPPLEATATLEPTAAIAEATSTVAPTKTPAATRTPTPTNNPVVSGNIVPISSITKDSVGQTVTVRGKVVDTSSFSAGFKFVLDDGTGKANLTLFSDDYKFVPKRAGLNYGADVQVTAEVAEFKGVLELQPKAGRDVQILTPGSSTGIPVTTINQLGKPGLLVAIEGKITDVNGFSAGTNLFVDDGTGNVRVTLFDNVKSYIPDADKLTPGAMIRVVGKTDFFGGVQVVPQLGYDVTIK